MTIATETQSDTIIVTDSAAAEIARLIKEEGEDGLKFRLKIEGGGCQGFQYALGFDTEINGDDIVVEKGGVQVLVDENSLPFLAGTELDFVEDLNGKGFALRNPNAASSCGCGGSFSA